MNLNPKYKIILIVAAVTLIAFLFLPYISIGPKDANIVDLFDMGLLDNLEFESVLTVILPIVAAIVIIVACFLNKEDLMFYSSIAGAVGLVLTFVLSDGADIGDIIEVIGIGFWLALIGFAANIYLTFKMRKEG